MERYEDPERVLHYKYQATNKSILDRVLKYWWGIAIRAVPIRASANLVSLIGNAFSFFSVAMLSGLIVGPMEKAGREKPWLFALVALGIFLYSTLDALDGIQARRTKSSGPLGEFVDHFFDCFNAFFFPLGMAAAFPQIPAFLVLIAICVCQIADWIVLLKVKVSNTLEFGYFSTDEAIFILLGIYISVWLFGYDFWAASSGMAGLSRMTILFLVMIFTYVGGGLYTLITAKLSCLSEIVTMIASFLPVAIWALVAERSIGRNAIIIAALLLGLYGSRFVADLLRSRLVGLMAPRVYPDALAASFLLLASAFLPELPSWLLYSAAGLFFVDIMVALVLQFTRTLLVIRKRLGIGLFGPLSIR